jgi:hypothetical protein
MPESLPENIAAARDALGYDEVGWYPLTWIPILAEFIDTMVIEGNTRIELFRRIDDMDVVDDATIDEALVIHHERVHFTMS